MSAVIIPFPVPGGARPAIVRPSPRPVPRSSPRPPRPAAVRHPAGLARRQTPSACTAGGIGARPGRTAGPATGGPVSPATYRRRRAVALAVVLGVVALLVVAVAGLLGDRPLTVSERRAPAGVDPTAVHLDARPVSRQVHIVQPGETVWSIARSLRADGDVRAVVDDLMAQVGDGPLQPGDRLVLP